MLKPPFKLTFPLQSALPSALPASGSAQPASLDACCAEHGTTETSEATAPHGRLRLTDLDPHLHCSVIGTCMTTAELRKLMARFLFVRDSTDLDVHHEAVRFAGQGGAIAKALHKALDLRHEAAVQRFGKARAAQEIETLWDEALRQGEVPAAYWAVLTHRDATNELRQKAFGEVHMLSHLVGSANRADIRRLVALERENADMRERLDRQQLRSQELLEERDRSIDRLRDELAAAQAERDTARAAAERASDARGTEEDGAAADRIAMQTARRERAEQAADIAEQESSRLREELSLLEQHARELHGELAAAETQLREAAEDTAVASRSLAVHLGGRRVFYVGGRPSSTPSIRDLVQRHGGEFQHHDGGFEDRKGLLASGIAWAQLVVFPVDCVDHDSASNLKRLCQRRQVPFVPLRSASVASFAAAIAAGDNMGGEADRSPPLCPKHG